MPHLLASVVCVLSSGLLCLSATAREPLYGALDHPGLNECEALRSTGEQVGASACYRGLVTNPAQPPQIRAEGMWAMGDLHTANNLFQTATESFPEDAMVRVRWGELFLETYQYQDALSLFEEALALDDGNAWAHIGAAVAMDGGDPQLVDGHLQEVFSSLSAPAGAKLRGRLLVLKATMERDQYDDATDMLADIRELAEDEDLPLMEVNAFAAALAFLQDRDPQPFIDAALEEHPGYGKAWSIPAYFASITRRYREAGDMYTQAVEVQPDLWTAHAELGQNHLRLNQIQQGIDHIRLAYEGDPFNPMTVNLLRLIDTFLEDFITVNYPDPPQGAWPELTLRLHRDERDTLREYARRLSQDSIDLYRERYRFEPKEPIIVEIYPNHEDFVVRTIGMPGVGVLGVTFGYLFAMDSPSGHPEPSYHWGTTLWHEMAHVFTVEASDHRVPRWFSEGTSVFEEWHTGPTPGRKIPVDVLKAMAAGRFLSVGKLDDGFMRPTYEGQVIVSYMQGGLIFDFIDDKWGYDPVVDMLYMFNDGATPSEAIEAVLGVSVGEFDQQFGEFIDQEFGDFLPLIDQWDEHRSNAYAAFREGNFQEAINQANEAIFIYPDYAEVDSPYVVLARAYAQLGNSEAEFEALENFWKIGGFAADALMALGDAYVERDQTDQAIEAYEDVLWIDPFREDLHSKLGDLFMEQQNYSQALTEFEVLLALDPIDKASANLRLAKTWQALGDETESMNYLMTALDIAPQYREAQMMLLELSRGAE